MHATTLWPPPELFAGYTGQRQADVGRFWQAPQFVASSLYRTKPERLMALLRILTVCLLV